MLDPGVLAADRFRDRARTYWTKERTQALIGDKPLLLLPADAAPLLRALGLLNQDASMPPAQVRKYRQINHMLLTLEPALNDLMTGPPLRLIDAGCGGSYLTLLLAWCFQERWKYPAEIIGIDRNAALVEKCRDRAGKLGLKVTYFASSIEAYAGERADAVLALHACDTATDDALALALRVRAELIAVVPCCQAELAAKCATQSGALAPMWQSPHLRRLAGSTLTDTLRLLLLRRAGYDAQAMEFVPTEHTPKNTLIRARRRRGYDAVAAAEYEALKQTLHGETIKLEALLTSPSAA